MDSTLDLLKLSNQSKMITSISNETKLSTMAREIEQEYSYNSFERAMNMIDLITVICLYSQMTLSIILNMIVVMYILINRFFAPINILILNLAVSDLMYASTIPFYVSQFMPQPVSQTQLGCRISLLIDWTSMIVSFDYFILYLIN